jgi:hypothetical protein
MLARTSSRTYMYCPKSSLRGSSHLIPLAAQPEPSVSMKWKLAFAIGIVVGLIALAYARVDYYEMMGYQPEMHPGIAFLFIPIIFAIVAIPASLCEMLLRKLWFAPHHWLVSALLGATQASLLAWWAFPDHIWIMGLLNPILLRVPIYAFVHQRWPKEGLSSRS